MSGWISLHRKIMDHPFYTEKRKFSRYEAWIDLIMLANHQDNKFMLGNQLVEVKRGSFITSELKLMDRWDWGKEKLRAYLRLLESDGMITKEANSKQTTITICNYDKHSSKSDRNEPSDTNGLKVSSDRQQTAGRPLADYGPYTNNNELIITNNDKQKDTQEEEPRTAMDAYFYSFKKRFYTGHIQGYVMKLIERGFTDSFVKEVFLEMGARGVGPDIVYMEKLGEDWISKKIYTRVEASQRRELQLLKGGQQNAKHGTGHDGRTAAELDAMSF